MTCKMLFTMDEPVCPFMSKVCINTPVAVETMRPESTSSIEKFGLFYPKIPQVLMAELAEGDPAEIAGLWVDQYLGFLNEWKFESVGKPFSVIRSFLIFVTGSVIGQRVDGSGVVYIVTDPNKIWKRGRLIPILEKSVSLLKKKLDISGGASIRELEITGKAPFGKYFCSMCRKFFEFSHQRETITCPIMAQKCMATPRDIESGKYTLADLAVMYKYTPDFYRRFIAVLEHGEKGRSILRKVLEEDWKFEIEQAVFQDIADFLGCGENV